MSGSDEESCHAGKVADPFYDITEIVRCRVCPGARLQVGDEFFRSFAFPRGKDLLYGVRVGSGVLGDEAFHAAEGASVRSQRTVPVGTSVTRVDGHLSQGVSEHLPQVGRQGPVEKGALTLFPSSVSHLRSQIRKMRTKGSLFPRI